MVAMRSPAQRRAKLAHHVLVYLRQAAQRGALFRHVTDLADRQFPLRLLHLLGVVELIQELPRRFRTRRRMSQHGGQSPVLTQAIEILKAVPAHRIQHQKALDIGGFIKTSVSLFHRQVSLHAARHIQRTGGAHK
jgi:hypothetical protein